MLLSVLVQDVLKQPMWLTFLVLMSLVVQARMMSERRAMLPLHVM